MYVGSRNPGTLRVAAVFHKDLQMSSNLFTGTQCFYSRLSYLVKRPAVNRDEQGSIPWA